MIPVSCPNVQESRRPNIWLDPALPRGQRTPVWVGHSGAREAYRRGLHQTCQYYDLLYVISEVNVRLRPIAHRFQPFFYSFQLNKEPLNHCFTSNWRVLSPLWAISACWPPPGSCRTSLALFGNKRGSCRFHLELPLIHWNRIKDVNRAKTHTLWDTCRLLRHFYMCNKQAQSPDILWKVKWATV